MEHLDPELMKIGKLYKSEKKVIDSLSCEAIQTCLKRSSLSLDWVKGCICGNIPLLSEVDVFSLKQYVIENSIEGDYLNAEDTVEKANFLRTERFRHDRLFLIRINCYGLNDDIREEYEIHDAGWTWVYQHLQELEAVLMTPRNIELNLLLVCTPDITFPILNDIEPFLLFCADETMLAVGKLPLNLMPHRSFLIPYIYIYQLFLK